MTSITRSTQSRRAMLAAAVVAAASMAGCASLSTKTPEQEVAELAQLFTMQPPPVPLPKPQG